MQEFNDNTNDFRWEDHESVTDQTLYSYGLITKKMRMETAKLLNSVAGQSTSTLLRQSNFVSFLILFRTNECMLALELLISKGFARDAAALILNLIELRLEMEYIALDHTWADDWISKYRKNKKAWKPSFLIKEVYPEKTVRRSERNKYKYFTKIKNENPMGTQPDFPFLSDFQDDDADVMPEMINGVDPDLLGICMIGEAGECYKTFKAAARDFADAGFDIKANVDAMDELNELLESLQRLRDLKPWE